MNNINNVMSLMDTSGMLLARNVMASGISKYDFYQFIRNNKLEKISHGVYPEFNSSASKKQRVTLIP